MLESSSLGLAVKGVDRDDNGEVKLGFQFKTLNRTVITQLANACARILTDNLS